MKRQELLSKIETLLNNLDLVTKSNKIKADIVLTEVENAGMTPPSVSKYVQEIDFEGLKQVAEWEN